MGGEREIDTEREERGGRRVRREEREDVPRIERKRAGWKTELNGRTEESHTFMCRGVGGWVGGWVGG